MLEEWYLKNPGKKLNGLRFDCRGADYNTLNELQKAHIRGEIDLYAPLENYSVEWIHTADNKGQFVKAVSLPTSKVRADLPSISVQWKQEYKRRHKT